MNRQLQTHLALLQAHLKRNYKRWFKTYPGIMGVHVGKKTINGKVSPVYSFVFHVDAKLVSPNKKIPPYLFLATGQRREKVPTDVIEAGKLELQGIKLGETTKNLNAALTGTISLYFEGSNGTYLGSNMHVLASKLLNNGQRYYDSRKDNNRQNIEFYDDFIGSTARLFVSRFDGIDFGFARVDNPALPENALKGNGVVKGYISLNNGNYRLYKMLFSGITSGPARKCTITELGAVKDTHFKNIFLTNLIKLNRCTDHGDSGAPLYDTEGRIAGVMVGFDKDASYALHIDDIIQFFQSSKL